MASSSVERFINAKGAEAPISEWRDLVRSWVTYLKAEDKSSATISNYEFGVTRRFLPWLVGIGWRGDLGGLSAEHFREWLNAMKDEGLKGASRLLYRQAVRSFFRFLKDEGEIAHDPFDGRGIPNPKPDEKLVQVLTGEEVSKMLKAASRDRQLGIRDVAIISTLFDAGLRASELCGLTLSDVDLDGALLVRHAKGSRPRIVSLGKQALRAIDRYVRWRREYVRSLKWVDEDDTGGALFISRTGHALHPVSLRTILDRAAKNADIDRRVYPHLFRHSSATALADSGVEEGDLRMLFGWAVGSPMAYRYTRSTAAERARRAHKRFSPLDTAARGH